MFRIPYDGSSSELGVISAVLAGERIANICDQFKYTPRDIVSILFDYMRHRLEFLRTEDNRRMIWETQVACLESYLEVFHPIALSGCLKTAQFCADLISRKFRLCRDIWDWEQKLAETAPAVPDSQKAQRQPTTPRELAEELHARFDDHEARGIKIDPAARLAADLLDRPRKGDR